MCKIGYSYQEKDVIIELVKTVNYEVLFITTIRLDYQKVQGAEARGCRLSQQKFFGGFYIWREKVSKMS